MRVYQFTGQRERAMYVPKGICEGTAGTKGERGSRAAANVVARGYAGGPQSSVRCCMCKT